jgi:hypothetical protein
MSDNKLKKRRIIQKKDVVDFDVTRKNIDMDKLKQFELKMIAKYYNLKISGSKTVLKLRIDDYHKKSKFATIIQKNIRCFFVRELFKLIASKSQNYVNESDFYSLEPLKDIIFHNLYSYTDEKNFTYGFDIKSIMILYCKTGKVINPYNRNKLSFINMMDIFSMYAKVNILFKFDVELNVYLPNLNQFMIHNLNGTYTIPDFDTAIENLEYQYQNQNVQTLIIPIVPNVPDFMLLIPVENQNVFNMAVLINKLKDIHISLIERREKSLETRVRELFIEIEMLGNFNDSTWLTNLDIINIYQLYLNLIELWQYRGNMDHTMKVKIYPFGDPFYNINGNIFTMDLTRDDILKISIRVMENFIFSGVDIEDRKIGAMHVISVLTSVSVRARREYQWLYEPWI